MAKFAAVITFGDRAKRDETRPAHRSYLTSLLESGKLHASGPFADDSGALIIYEAADEAEAHALLRGRPLLGRGDGDRGRPDPRLEPGAAARIGPYRSSATQRERVRLAPSARRPIPPRPARLTGGPPLA